MGLIRLEYVTTRMMFETLSKAEVESILSGARDAEVYAWNEADKK